MLLHELHIFAEPEVRMGFSMINHVSSISSARLIGQHLYVSFATIIDCLVDISSYELMADRTIGLHNEGLGTLHPKADGRY